MRRAKIMEQKVAKNEDNCNIGEKQFFMAFLWPWKTTTMLIKPAIKISWASLTLIHLYLIRSFHNLKEQYLTLNYIHSLGKCDYPFPFSFS